MPKQLEYESTEKRMKCIEQEIEMEQCKLEILT